MTSFSQNQLPNTIPTYGKNFKSNPRKLKKMLFFILRKTVVE